MYKKNGHIETLVFNTCLCNMHFRIFVYAICIFHYMLYAIFRLCSMHDCGGEQSLCFAIGKSPGLTFLLLLSQFLFWILTHTRQTFLLWLGGVRWLMPSWCRSLKYETTAVAIDTRLLSFRCTFSFRMYSLQSRYLWLAPKYSLQFPTH